MPRDERWARVRAATTGDAQGIAGIYNHYVANTVITFEEQIVTPEQMAERIETVGDDADLRQKVLVDTWLTAFEMPRHRTRTRGPWFSTAARQ